MKNIYLYFTIAIWPFTFYIKKDELSWEPLDVPIGHSIDMSF